MTQEEYGRLTMKMVVLDLVEPFQKAHLDWFNGGEDMPFKEFVEKHFDKYFSQTYK